MYFAFCFGSEERGVYRDILLYFFDAFEYEWLIIMNFVSRIIHKNIGKDIYYLCQ